MPPTIPASASAYIQTIPIDVAIGTACVTVTVVEADMAGFWNEVAVMVIVAVPLTVAGGVNTPAVETAPLLEVHIIPEPRFWGTVVQSAVSAVVRDFGVHDTVGAGTVTVMLAEPDFVGSCVDVAVTVTVAAVDGVVNTPEGVIDPPPTTVHVTPELNAPVPVTVEVKFTVCPVVADVVAGETVTEAIVGGIAVTVMLAEPDFVGSCVDVAVQMRVPTPEGVATPVVVIVPPVAVQFTD